MWISQENENSQRATDHQSQKSSGQKETHYRVGLCFPKSIRILSRRYFLRLSSDGLRMPGTVLFFQYTRGKSPSRLGITVSKKYGKAHDRNRFKRLVREVFRECFANIPEGTQLNVLPRLPRRSLDKSQVIADFLFFISSLEKASCQ